MDEWICRDKWSFYFALDFVESPLFPLMWFVASMKCCFVYLEGNVLFVCFSVVSLIFSSSGKNKDFFDESPKILPFYDFGLCLFILF